MQEQHCTKETSSEKIGPGTMWNEEPRKDKKRLWKCPECKIGIKNPGTRWQLQPKSRGHQKGGFHRLESVK
jgi:rubredoxin